MRWLSSFIDALKMGKTVKMSISRWNFSFQHKRCKLQPYIWRLHKILRHSFSAWSEINDVNANFLNVFYVSSASNYVRKPSQNSAYSRNEIWPWNRDFQGQGCLLEFFTIFFIFSTWNYIEIPSQILMTNETNFLHCTLRCLQGSSIYRPIELKFVTSRVTNFFFLFSSYDQQDSQKFAK